MGNYEFDTSIPIVKKMLPLIDEEKDKCKIISNSHATQLSKLYPPM